MTRPRAQSRAERRTEVLADERAKAIRKRRGLRNLVMEHLEDRTLLSVTASLIAGQLDIDLSAPHDQVVISPSGSSILVNGTDYSTKSFAGVTALQVQGGNTSSQDDPNQSVTFEGAGTITLDAATGSDALSVTGVTSVTFTNIAIDVPKNDGNVNVEAAETTSAASGSPQAAISVTGSKISADNITLVASASSTYQYSAPLGGNLNSLGVAAAVADLEPSAAVTVTGSSTKLSVNKTSGNVTIEADSVATIDSSPTVGKTIGGSALNPGDAAIAESVVNSSAVAQVGGGSTVNAGSSTGTLSITSTNTTTVTTDVDGTGAIGGATGAVTLDNSTSQAFVDGGSTISGRTVNVSAVTTNTADTTATSTATGAGSNAAIQNLLAGKVDPAYLAKVNPSSTNPAFKTSPALTAFSGGLPLAVAGAVAITKFTPTTQAYVDSSTVTAGKAINIGASSDNNTTTTADGEATTANASTGVAAAVAISNTIETNAATIESTTGTTSLTAPTINVAATTPTASDDDEHDVLASATSGTSATQVGLAGALALNIVSNTSEASVPSGSTVSTVGNVAFNAQDSTTETATAQPPDGFIGGVGAGEVGIGASVALNIDTNTTLAELADTAQLTGADDLTFTATSVDTINTNAVDGSSGGSASLSPSVGTSVATNTTTAEVGAPDGANDVLTIGGAFLATATHTGVTSTSTGANSDDAEDLSVGASVALGFVTDVTTATTNRSITAQGGGVDFEADNSAASLVSSSASADGGPSDSSSVDSQNSVLRSFADSMGTLVNSVGTLVGVGSTKTDAATPSAQTSDGSVTVAAAVAVNIVDSEANAIIPSGLTITAAGAVTVIANNDTGNVDNVVYGDTANAWGTDAGEAKVGVGAAVGINLVNDLTEATIGASTIISTGVTVNAGMPDDSSPNDFSANATSGAGSSSVGVSGAVAINIVNDTSEALIEPGASVNAGGGDVAVTSLNASSDLTFAVPAGAATGDSLGVGASVALNIITNVTESEIQNGAALTNAGNVTVTANAPVAITTWGQNGAEGGVATAGGVAIAIASDTTTASIGSDATTLNANGGLTIDASGSFSVNSLADSAANASGSVGLGASVVVNDTQDLLLAELGRNVSAGGAVSVTAEGIASSQATAVASELGAGKSDDSADQQAQNQSSLANKVGGSDLPSVPPLPTSNSQMTSASSSASSDSGGSDGETKTGIAASVAVNVFTTSTIAKIDNNVTVTTSGSLTVGTTNQSGALSLADSRAVANQTSIGAAVSLNVVNVTNTATTGGGDTISADGVSVTALMPAPVDNTLQVNDFSTQALGVAIGSQTGIAGAAGINVITIATTAYISGSSSIKSFGGLNVRAANDETLQNIAFTLAVGEDTGAGAAVNVNVLNNPTTAFIAANAQANAADATRVTAESSLNPSQDAIPNSTSDTLIATGTLTKGSTKVSSVDGSVISVLGSSANTPLVLEPVTGTGIPSGTVIARNHVATFTGIMEFGSDEILSDDSIFFDPLNTPKVGDTVSGPGIIPGATIIKIEYTLDEGAKITISEPVFASGANPLAATDLELSKAATASGAVTIDATPVAGLVSDLSSLHPTNFAAGVGGASGGNGIAGSFSVNVISEVTHAFINNGAQINTLVGTTGYPTANSDEGVTVSATETMSIVDWDGAAGAGEDSGVGAALDVNIVTEDTQAYTGSTVTIVASQNVVIEASSVGNFSSITAAVALSESAGIAGAASIEVLSPTTNAYIGNKATVNAQGNVLVQASRQAGIDTIAGQAAVGEENSVGAAVSTVVETVNTDAYLSADDVVTARGRSGTIAVLDPGMGGTTPFLGVAVVAANFLDLQTIAAGGSVSGEGSLAGSATVNVLNDTTLAYIAAGAVVSATDDAPGTGPGVMVSAGDLLSLLSTAGAAAAGGDDGLGVGADVDSISKNTEAYIATANVAADGDVLVTASSAENLTSISASVGLGGETGVAGSASVYVLSITTRAFIGDDPSNPTPGATNVLASGSILVSASEQTLLNIISGNFAGSGEASLGAAAGVPVITKTTEAFVGAGANVTALGQGSPIQADNGVFEISYAPYGTAVGVAQPNWQNSNLAGNSGASLTAPTSPRLGEERIATPATESIHGLAVTAVNSDAIQGVGVDGGVSGGVAANLSGTVGVITNSTKAYIGSGAIVNSSNAGAAGGQSVWVAAGNDTSFLGIAGALSLAGDVSITPGVVVMVLNNTVIAAIDDGATVTAAGDIAVQAHSSGDILSVAASGALAGEVGVGGAVAYVGVNDTTDAYIGDTATTDAAGAHASAGGNVLVDATDDTVAYMVTGSLAIGLGTAGIGGAVSIALLDKNTDAYIGSHATVNALGNSSSLSGIFAEAPSGVETLATFHGVAVQAESSENVTNIAVAGGLGFYAGLAGGVSVEIFDSNTSAYIGASAHINASSTGASSAQAVDVAAVNHASNFSFAGAIAGAIFAALAGGVDVGLMQNSTTAYIGNGSDVHAKAYVDVFAFSSDTVRTYALGLGISAVALEASVSVWSIGDPYNDNYVDGDGESGYGSSIPAIPMGDLSKSNAYSEGSTGSAASLIGSLTNSNNNGATGNTQYITSHVQSARTGVTGSIAGDPVTNALNNQAVPQGTVAFIGSDVAVTAGGSVNVQANSLVSDYGIVGGLTAGIVGLGASIEITNVRGNTQAYIDAGSNVTAGGNVSVGAQLVSDNVNGTAFAGDLAVLAVGAQVVDIQDTSTVSAALNSGVVIPRAQEVLVTAATNRDLVAQATGGLGGFVTLGAGVAIADAKGGTSATIGSGVLIGQTGTVGGLDVAANSVDSVVALSSAVTAGIGSATANVADAEVTPTILASIGSNSLVDAGSPDLVDVGQNVAVTAGSEEEAQANASGVHVAGLTIGVSLADANLTPNVSAFIGTGANVVSTAGTITVSATQQTTNGAQASGSNSDVGVITGDGSNITAIADAKVSSDIGSGATVTTPQTVTIAADGTNIATADATTLSIGVGLNVGVVLGYAYANGSDTAYLGAGAIVGSPTRKGGGLVVTATGSDQSSATADLSGGGIFSGEGGTATAESEPTLNAYLDAGSSVDVTGNITVESTSMTDADGSANGRNGGIVDVNVSTSYAVVSPTLNTYIGSNAVIVAGGNITVESLHGAAPVPTSNGTFTPSQVSNNTITFPNNTGLQTGDTVTYSQNGNPPIGGLTSGRVYPVIATSGNTLQLGVSSSVVDEVNDTISFSSPDDLQSGDEVVYEPNYVYPIYGLTPGATYEVYVLTPESIKLLPAGSPLPTLKSFDPADQVSDNYIDISGFTDGEAVTYNAPAPLEFQPEQVSNSTIDLGTDSSGNPILYPFTNGEKVTYEPVDNATVIGGLTAGNNYYVIAIAPNEFQLSKSLHNGVPGAPITLQVPANATGLQSFSATDQQAIGGLVSGQTYYVINATEYNFQLSAEPDSNKVISLNVSHSSGIHTIGVEGIDFTTYGSNTGSMNLVFPLSTAGASGTYQLIGVGGPTGVLFNSSGGGANAIASGSNGGGVDIGGSSAEADSLPTLSTYLGTSTTLTAGGDIAITATSYANADGDGTNSGGGFISVGQGIANVTVYPTVSVNVGDSDVITTQGNFTLQALSNNKVVASTDSDGGGAVQIADAVTTVTLYPMTSAAVGTKAQITAGSGILVSSQTNTTASDVNATANGDGLGVNSYSDAELDLTVPYPGNPIYAYTETTIDTGAALAARNTTIQAVTSYDLVAASTSTSGALGAKGQGDATANADDTSLVTIMSGAMITGTDSVDIEARHDNSEVFSISSCNTDVGFGQAFSTATTNAVGPSWFNASQPDVSEVNAEAGATIVTPDLEVKALADIFADYLSSATGGAFVVHYAYLHGQILANRVIHWNSDVVSGGGGGNNLLIVNSNGSVDPSSTITPTITATQIIVPNINGGGVTGTINFQTNELERVGTVPNSNVGLLDGNQATFYYATTAGEVQLLNYSQKNLVVNGINVLGSGSAVPNVGIDVANDTEPGDPFGFKVAAEPASTLVDIENRSTTASPNIILSGLINNPIGTTKILNSSGSILSAGPSAVVLTNILDVEAANGSIGSSAQPFNAELVQSESSSLVQRPIDVTVLAGGNAYLNFTGILRDPDFNLGTTPFVVSLGSVQAGGNVVALLQESVQESGSGGSSGNVIVYEYYPALLTTVTSYFRPGSGSGPGGSTDPGFGDSDPTLISSTYDFASLTAGGNITLTGVPASTKIAGKTVTPNINIVGSTNINPTPSATGEISASTNGDITFTETVGAMRVGAVHSTGGNILLMVPNNAASGDDFAMASGSSVIASKGSVTIDVADNVTLALGSSITAALTALIQGDFGKLPGVVGSVINIIGQIFAPIADVNGGPDDDTISLTNVPAGTRMTINTGGGVNTVNVGSIAPPEPNHGVLNNIQGSLTVIGNGSDTLNADATGNTAAKTGTLTATTLTGLSMGASGMTYSGLADLNIDLGSGGNTFVVSNTAAGTSTFLNSGTGKDTIDVNATTGPLTVNTGGGTNKNTVNVGSLEPATGGVLNDIQGVLSVIGNGFDTMNADATGNYLPKIGTLTATTLTGLSMGASGIAYSGLSALNISLGSGGNTFTVASTAVGTTTTLNSGTGDDTVNVTTTSSPLTVNTQTGTDTVNVKGIGAVATINAGGGNDKINVSSDAPTNTGELSGITALLTINGGTGSTSTNVSDIGDTTTSTSTLTPTTFTSTAFGTGGSLRYSSLTALNISMGSGGNTFNITNTAAATTTTINSGTGSDTINVRATSGPTTVNTGGGTNENIVNVGSLEPTLGGFVGTIQGALTVTGNAFDTMNVDDTGSTVVKTGTLSATALTGLNMGPSGIAYSGLADLNINLGRGGNTLLITNTAAATTTFVNSGRGADTVNIQATSGPLTVNTGGGTKDNTINVGSLAPATGGKVNYIQGPLTVIGNGTDTMNVDDTAATAGKTATLTATTLTGMSMGASGITYSGLSILNVDLGLAADVVDVKSSASGTTSTFVTQATGNTWNVGSNAPTLTGGVLSGIQGPVVIDGGGSNTALTDTINFDDSGSTNPSEYGVLTDDSLTKLGMTGGVTFFGQAVLNMDLGNNGAALQGFITNNLPALTNITGGSANTDSFISGWDNDFNGTLNLAHIGDAELDVSGQFYGHLNTSSPAYIDSLIVGGSVNAGSTISAQQIDSLFIGVNLDINLTLPGIAGAPAGTDALGNATIGGSLPEGITLTAASIGSLAVGTNAALAPGSHNLAGIVDVTPGDLGSLTIGPDGSITTTAQVNVAGDLDTMTMLGSTPNVGQVMAGTIDVVGTLGTATIAGGTPGLFIAGHVGTIGAYGGFGPIVLRVIEAGVQRWLEEDPAGQVFSQPDAAATATTPGEPNYINTQYFYESAGFTSPQISARITNGVSSAPDQFDLSTVVFQDGASFNLDRLDASGVSGIRNVAVEGSLVTTLTSAAENFFLLPSGIPDPSPAGIYLPSDNLASVSVRDYAPDGSIDAADIQAVAFGSFTSSSGAIEQGSDATITDASNLLEAGTTILPAGSVNGQGNETFRAPFAALPGQQVAFFLDTAPSGGTFDPKNMVLTLESDSDGVDPATLFPATRGAVTAMIGVDETPQGSVVQTVALYGDGGSIWSEQFIAQSVTSTGPLGDLTVLAPQGLNDVTAPSIFGSISAAGPLFGTIQTTGVRTDPVTGAVSMIPADLGRVYVVPAAGRSAKAYVTATTIEGQGSDSLTGQIISRGNLISSIRSDDGASGVIAAQGNFGAMTTLLGTPTRVGGLLVNGGFSGQLVVLGNDYGDLTFNGGLTGGRIAVKGTGGVQSGILGNVIIDRGLYPTGSIGAGSAIVSGGEIGDASLGTALSVTDSNDGIVAAIGTIRVSNGLLGGDLFNDVGATPGNPSAAAIDAIFSDNGQSLGLDLPNQPLAGLALILEDLAALNVDSDDNLAD